MFIEIMFYQYDDLTYGLIFLGPLFHNLYHNLNQ